MHPIVAVLFMVRASTRAVLVQGWAQRPPGSRQLYNLSPSSETAGDLQNLSAASAAQPFWLAGIKLRRGTRSEPGVLQRFKEKVFLLLLTPNRADDKWSAFISPSLSVSVCFGRWFFCYFTLIAPFFPPSNAYIAYDAWFLNVKMESSLSWLTDVLIGLSVKHGTLSMG